MFSNNLLIEKKTCLEDCLFLIGFKLFFNNNDFVNEENLTTLLCLKPNYMLI